MSFFDDLDELLEGEPPETPPVTKPPPTKKPRKKRTAPRKKPQDELQRLQNENQELKNEIQSLRAQLKSSRLDTSIPTELPEEETHGIEVEIPVEDKGKIITYIKHLETTKNATSISALIFIANKHPQLVSEDEILQEGFFCRKKYITNVFRKRYAQTQEGGLIGKPVEHHRGLLIIVTQQGEVYYRLSSYGEKFFQLYFDYFKKENVIARINNPRFAHMIHSNDFLMYRFVHKRFVEDQELTLREDLWELSYYQIAESAKNLIELGLLSKEVTPHGIPPGTTCWRPRYPEITPDLLLHQ